MFMNVKYIIRGRRYAVVLKATNKAELRMYNKIYARLMACKTADERDLILCNK